MRPMTEKPQLTDEQDATLTALNNKWGVASWRPALDEPDGTWHVELDDGDSGLIHPDGSNTWGV